MKTKTKPTPSRAKAKRKVVEEPRWITVESALPRAGALVLAHYRGVYNARVVMFWRDQTGRPRFGIPGAADGLGSQPATHWFPIPSKYLGITTGGART